MSDRRCAPPRPMKRDARSSAASRPVQTLKAVAVVDGERLESEAFPAPARGGIRLLLVATDTSKGGAAAAGAPAVAGQVAIGGQSRIIIQPGEETVEIYYLLDIVNGASGPVNPPAAFVFDMPSGATGTGILEGSSPNASAKDQRVTVAGAVCVRPHARSGRRRWFRPGRRRCS